jgi:nicotinate-nucleotide pyrophosphorylase (carboxylating)
MKKSEKIDKLIRAALKEDIGKTDVTTEAIVPATLQKTARIISKQSGVVAGIEIARRVFWMVDHKLEIRVNVRDGMAISPKTEVLIIKGKAKSILSGERLTLNLLSHASGIATLTRKFVEAVEGTKAKILDTRKTIPLWRELERDAVRAGGGENHRFNLNELILIKENHISAAGGMIPAIEKAVRYVARHPKLKVIVECRNPEDVKKALNYSVDRLLLDNFTLEQLPEAVRMVDQKIPLEASGNVTLENVRAIAQTGVDYISVGAITHSAPAFDFSLLMD